MTIEHRPGAQVMILNQAYQPAAEAVVEYYIVKERSYRVGYIYPQTGEKEFINVPEWRLTKKQNETKTKGPFFCPSKKDVL